MRRAIVGLAATAFTLLAVAGPASAAKPQMMKINFSQSGSFAQAEWVTNPASTNPVDTTVDVYKAKKGGGSQLLVDEYAIHLDANGNFIGLTDTTVNAGGGFSFTPKQPLASASLSGSVPATRCRYDANLNVIGCTALTIDVSVAWTGQGSISHQVYTSIDNYHGFHEVLHFNGTNRFATARGTVAGLSLPLSDNLGGFSTVMGTVKDGGVTICKGNACQ